jgi:hypothetical protein
MTTYVRGTIQTIHPGSDPSVRWLTLHHASGLVLTCMFDPHGLTRALNPGSTVELALEVTYPPTHARRPEIPWQAYIVDLTWPRPVVGIARAPLPRPKDRAHGQPTGPTCVLLQTHFGHMLTTMSHLAYFGVTPHKGAVISISPTQRFIVLAVL